MPRRVHPIPDGQLEQHRAASVFVEQLELETRRNSWRGPTFTGAANELHWCILDRWLRWPREPFPSSRILGPSLGRHLARKASWEASDPVQLAAFPAQACGPKMCPQGLLVVSALVPFWFHESMWSSARDQTRLMDAIAQSHDVSILISITAWQAFPAPLSDRHGLGDGRPKLCTFRAGANLLVGVRFCRRGWLIRASVASAAASQSATLTRR